MNALNISVSADERRKVERIITKTYHSLLHGEEYNKGRKSRKNLTAIADGDNIQKLVADYREAGLSFSQMTVMINIYCRKNGLLTVRRSAVVSCEKRMKRRVAPVTKRPQGSLDKKSNWTQAHYGWVMQLLLRFDIDVCLDPFLKESTGIAVPLWFDKTHLRPFNKFGIGWWDKTHKECEIGAYLGEQVLYLHIRNAGEPRFH
jgi:hypothetical protein